MLISLFQVWKEQCKARQKNYRIGDSKRCCFSFCEIKMQINSMQSEEQLLFLLIISFCLILSDNCASRKKKAQLWLIFICWIFYIRFVDISSLLIVPSHWKYYITNNSSKQRQLSWSSPLKSEVLEQEAQLEPKQLIWKVEICASAIKPFFKKSKKER